MDREKAIVRTSVLGIITNVIIASIKIVIGLAVSSIAIMAEGANNATDAVTSILTIVGTKVAGKKPDAKHPFGYGRIEYITSLVISAIILFSGFGFLKSSFELIFQPAELCISRITLYIIAFTGLIKFLLGSYTIKIGKEVESSSLIGVGVEGRNDSITSLVTILSAVVFLVFKYQIDAFAGIFTSVIIIKSGAEILFETVGELLGKPAKKELADQLYQEIKNTEGIINAADMMLHNYGPDEYSGSVNIEIDHKKTIGEIYTIVHELQLRIMHQYNVTMVFGMYAVDEDSPESKKLRSTIAAFVRSAEYVNSYHAVYFSQEENKIYCDFVVDYKLKDWDSLEASFKSYMKDKYPLCAVELTIETEFV